MLRITAPEPLSSQDAFRFVGAKNLECNAQVRVEDWVDQKGRLNKGRQWREDESSCRLVAGTEDRTVHLYEQDGLEQEFST